MSTEWQRSEISRRECAVGSELDSAGMTSGFAEIWDLEEDVVCVLDAISRHVNCCNRVRCPGASVLRGLRGV